MIFSRHVNAFKKRPYPEVENFSDEIHVISSKEKAPKDVPPEKLIAVGKGMTPRSILDFFIKTGVNHLIQAEEADLGKHLAAAGHLITDTRRFIENPGQCILGFPAGQDHGVRFRVKGSKERQFIHSSISTFVETLPAYETVRESILIISDELVTNAIFNAPRDEGNQKQFAKLDRNEDVRLDHGFWAELFVMVDENDLLIGCRDPYGSIDRIPFLKRLANSYPEKKHISINMEKGGAGIGCRMILDHCTSFWVAVEKNKESLVCCVVPLRKRMKSMSESPKTIHISIKG